MAGMTAVFDDTRPIATIPAIPPADIAPSTIFASVVARVPLHFVSTVQAVFAAAHGRVGRIGRIGPRTLAAMFALVAFMAYDRIATPQPLDRVLIAFGPSVTIVAVFPLVLPTIDESPADPSATLFGQPRIASTGIQGVFRLVTADLLRRLIGRRRATTPHPRQATAS